MVRSKNTGAVSSSLLKNSFYSPFRSKRKISFRRKPNKKRDSSDNVGPRNGRLGLFQQAVRRASVNHRSHPGLDVFDCAHFAGGKPVDIFSSRVRSFLWKRGPCVTYFPRRV